MKKILISYFTFITMTLIAGWVVAASMEHQRADEYREAYRKNPAANAVCPFPTNSYQAFIGGCPGTYDLDEETVVIGNDHYVDHVKANH